MSVIQTATAEAASQAQHRLAMTRRQRWHQHLIRHVVMDILTASVAFSLAYVLRYILAIGGDVPGENFVDFTGYLPVGILFVALCIFGYQRAGTYALPRATSLAAEGMSVIGSSAAAAWGVFLITALIRYPANSRLIFVYAWLLTCALGILGRSLLRALRVHAYRRGADGERVLVVGNNHLARMIMQMLVQQTHLGYRVMGFVDDAVRADFGRFRAFGAVRALPGVIEQAEIEHVIVALPASQHNEILWVLNQAERAGVSVSLVPDLFELRLSHVNLETVGGLPLFAVRESRISGLNLLLKRALDVVIAAAALVVLAPVCAVIAMFIKLNDGGPILFSQIRCGKGNTRFRFYKFRSMRQGAHLEQVDLEALNEADGPVFKIREDPRITRVGRIIRRTSLDEIPQFWNILRGEMSLVGPRPPIPEEVERYEEWHRRRLEVVPGLTGLWQVSGRSGLSFDEWVMLDIYYIENWSLGLDLQIMARTIPAVFARAGAF